MAHTQRIVAHLLILVGCCFVWTAASAQALAQVKGSAASSMQAWRRHSQGLSSNAALARYRIADLDRRAQQSYVRRHPAGFPGTTLYSAPYYAITTHRTIPDRSVGNYPSSNAHYFPAGDATQTQKPFNNIRYQPNAVQRYWPYMLEAREDPKTGLVIWRLP